MPHTNCFFHKKPGCEAGFTLMEMILVTLLGALFFTLAIPSLRSSIYTNELNSSARRVTGIVREVRHLAVREHKPYLLHFDRNNNRIWHELEGTVDPFNDEPDYDIVLPDGIRFGRIATHFKGDLEKGQATMWISEQGHMDQSIVQLIDESGEDLFLFFSPFSGTAQIHEEEVAVR